MSANFYATPSTMVGGGFTVYGGYRRQRGAGVFGSFRKYLAPVGRQALSGIKQIARNKTVQKIAKQAAAKGAEVLSGVAIDALQGRNIGESFKERGREVALRTLTGETAAAAAPATNRNRKRQANRSKSRKGKRAATRLKQRKRSASFNALKKATPAKKRRRTLSRAALNRRDLF